MPRLPGLAHLLGDRAGVTLIEVLIASLVVGIGVVGLALLLGNGQAGLSAQGTDRVAVFVAQQAMEHCRWQGFASATAGTVAEQVDPQVDPNSSTADKSNPCAPASASNVLTANCTTSTTVCYSRTTVVDCVAADDYTTSADCTATPTPPKRITVTVQGGKFDGVSTVVVDPRVRSDITLRSVLANR